MSTAWYDEWDAFTCTWDDGKPVLDPQNVARYPNRKTPHVSLDRYGNPLVYLEPDILAMTRDEWADLNDYDPATRTYGDPTSGTDDWVPFELEED